MAFSYLPKQQEFPHYQPSRQDLEDHQRNPVTLEFLSRLREAHQDQQGRVLDSADQMTLIAAKGALAGLAKAFEILEDIADSVRSGERQPDGSDAAGVAATGAGEN